MTAERARITVFDTTLRDGEQSPGCSMNQQEKLRLAHQLDRLGVDVIEAGFPIASDGDFESVKAIASVVRRPIIAGLARACRPDIERAWEALKDAARPRIHVFLATSDIHLTYKLRITRDQCVEQAREAIGWRLPMLWPRYPRERARSSARLMASASGLGTRLWKRL